MLQKEARIRRRLTVSGICPISLDYTGSLEIRFLSHSLINVAKIFDLASWLDNDKLKNSILIDESRVSECVLARFASKVVNLNSVDTNELWGSSDYAKFRTHNMSITDAAVTVSNSKSLWNTYYFASPELAQRWILNFRIKAKILH